MEHNVVGTLIIDFDGQGNCRQRQEGSIQASALIVALEVLKAKAVNQLLLMEQQALAQQQARSIVLPNGPIPRI